MIQPPFLTPGDTVYITAPAKAIEETSVLAAKKTLETWGLNVRIAPHCLGRHHYFSGTDEERLADFQDGLDDPSIKAILCARGGYGCVRIVEALNWDTFKRHPKWIIGFSDVTVFHQKIHQFGIESIHGIMPLGFTEGSVEAKETLRLALFGKSVLLETLSQKENKLGEVRGPLGACTLLEGIADRVVVVDDHRAVGAEALHRERTGYADFGFVLVGLVVQLLKISIGCYRCIDLFLQNDPSVTPFAM